MPTTSGGQSLYLATDRSRSVGRCGPSSRRVVASALTASGSTALNSPPLRLPAAGRDPVGARRPDRIRCVSRAACCAPAGGTVSGVFAYGGRPASRTGQGLRSRLSAASGVGRAADHVVVCAGYESLDFLPRKVADINNTFALVTEPLADRPAPARCRMIWESARPYLYVRGDARRAADRGRRRCAVQEPAARDALLPRQVAAARRKYRDLFGADMPPIAYAWARQFRRDRDGLPSSGARPGSIRACNSRCVLAAMGSPIRCTREKSVRAGIENRAHELTDVFGFARLGIKRLAPAGEGRYRVRVLRR